MDNFHYRIKFGDIEVEGSGSEEFVKEIKAYADELIKISTLKLKTIGAISPTTSPKVDTLDTPKENRISITEENIKEESLAEFLEKLPSRTHQEKILAFGFYLEKNRNMPTFGVKEINDCYDEVKEAKSNTAQYMALLIKSGLIMKAKNSGSGGSSQYTLTRKGENAIKNAGTA